MKIVCAKDYQDMSRKAANIISAQVILKPQSVLGLATGSTPLGTYAQLIDWFQKGDLSFAEVRSVNLDEYCGLGRENDQSYNYYMHENFFRHIDIRPENTHLPNGLAKDMQAECGRYDALIESLGQVDMQVLGIGHTGHIGFNEPSDAFDKTTHCVALNEKTIEANARFFDSIDEVPRTAVTMGIQTIMRAKSIILLANGASKQEILLKALFGPITPWVPASILQLHSDLIVVADAEALELVRREHPGSCQ